MNPETLVCFAVKQEAAAFIRLARNRKDIQVLITGMGARNAETSVRRTLDSARPRRVVTAGFAGGLRPGLQGGTVVFAAEGQSELNRALQAAGAEPARFHFVERVASTVAEKRRLREQTGADAVEMESKVICAICREQGIPSATVRVILDPSNEDLPLDFNELMTSDQNLDGRKLARAVLESPGKIRGLVRLQNQSKAAARKLAEVLKQTLLPPDQSV
jgi:adenosylhomocysteine nucleosidase